MTERDASPPPDPQPNPPIARAADPEAWPTEWTLREGQAAAPAPETPPLPPPYSPPAPPLAPPPSAPTPTPHVPEPPAPPPPPRVGGGGADGPRREEPRRGSGGWPALAHLTSLFDFGFSVLIIGLLGPLVIWLMKRDEDPETDWHGRESLNFQLNLILYWIAATPLVCLCGLGLLIWTLLPLYKVVMVAVASYHAAEGKRFRYPFTLRLLND